MYLVNAYLSYNDYLEGEAITKFIFKSKEEYERLFLEYTFFTNLYVIFECEISEFNYTIYKKDIL